MWPRLLTLFILCMLSVTGSGVAGSLSLVSHDRWVTVQSVTDGDTFTTLQGEKIRLLGINSPEIRHESSPAQPFGNKAKRALQQLIAGQQLRLSFDKEKKDQYQRTLAHVYQKNGLWVNAEMVRQGLAHVYTFFPNTGAAADLLNIEQQAISQKKNMWQHKRWQVLSPELLEKSMLGQFRLVTGEVSRSGKSPWQFKLGKLHITVPLKYRQGFRVWKPPRQGERVVVRGKLRMSSKGRWFLSVHTPADITTDQ